jgi:hypothetical protein
MGAACTFAPAVQRNEMHSSRFAYLIVGYSLLFCKPQYFLNIYHHIFCCIFCLREQSVYGSLMAEMQNQVKGE